ncbi:RHS repeat domain-containing protein [Algicola sagamiensis]|uniref:RHS repeat domain-containing protein n=1 Tax=Algicola sagamiensis TaxID=163869 RepID=UPI00146E2062|nr:RHS repeat-associated core domain-containing protein [Algicola sagamiensis]
MSYTRFDYSSILFIKDGNWHVAFHQSPTSTLNQKRLDIKNSSSLQPGQITTADVNGDGQMDKVELDYTYLLDKTGSAIYANINQNGELSKKQFRVMHDLGNVKSVPLIVAGNADVNGDGVTDIILKANVHSTSGGNSSTKPVTSPVGICSKYERNEPGIYRHCLCQNAPDPKKYGCVRGIIPEPPTPGMDPRPIDDQILMLVDTPGDHVNYRMKRSTSMGMSASSTKRRPSSKKNRLIALISKHTKPITELSKLESLEYEHVSLGPIDDDTDFQFVDLNRDGLSDILYKTNNLISYQLSNGFGFNEEQSLFLTRSSYRDGDWTVKETFSNVHILDLDNDGKLEAYYDVKGEKHKVVKVQSHSYWIRRNKDVYDYFHELRRANIEVYGSGQTLKGVSTNNLVASVNAKDVEFRFVDQKGNGHPDLMIFDGDKKRLYIKRNQANHNFLGDKLKKLTVGYSPSTATGANISTEITYTPMRNRRVYDPETRSNTTTYVPKNGQPLVSKVTSSTYDMALGRDVADTVTYKYAGLKLDRRGLGNLGFRQITSTSSRDGTKTVTTYGQSRYNRMMPLKTKAYFANGKLSKVSENRYKTMRLVGDHKSYVTYANRVTDQTYTMTSDGQHRYLGKTETIFEQDRYGNMTSSIVNMFDDSGTVLHRTTTENEFGSQHEEKRYGRLSEVKVTKKQFAHTIAGVTQPESTMRKRSLFTYYQDGVKKGMLKSEITEPGLDTEKTVTRDYDAFGNTVITKSQTKLGARVASVQYDSRGRYVDHTTDALGRKTYHFYNGRSAEEVEGPFYSQATVSPAKLITTQYFSNYGLVIRTVYPDGTEKRTTKSYCQGSCWGKSLIQVVESKTGMSDSVSYLDRYGRTVMTENTLLDGSVSQTRTTYNADNQVVRAYQPAKGSAQSSIYVETRYDQYKRPVAKVHSNGSQKTIGYYGRVTEVSNLGHLPGEYIYVQNVVSPLGSEIVTFAPTTQAQMGETGQVSQRARVQKTYDAYGQLQHSSTFAQDANGDMQSSVVSVTYDNYGRKLTTTDPEKGTWTYTYDASGMLKTQTDANGNVKTLTYDPYGRLVQSTILNWQGKTILTCQRYEDKQVPWVGSVVEESISEVDAGKTCADIKKSDAYEHRAYQFDNLGRATQTTTTLDKTKAFITGVTYDEFGRVATQIYPNGFTVRNEYADNGQLKAIYNAQSGDLYQRVDAVDALGRVTKETVLGGVTRSKGFDAQRGWVKDIRISSNAHGDLYHVSYAHYENGSTKTRSSEYFDNTGASDNTTPFLSVEENFTFDKPFDRLTKRTVNFKTDILNLGDAVAQAQEFRYDGFGNMTYMTGAGEYVYDADKPHRLAFIRNEQDPTKLRRFYYDASGNISWQSGEGEKHFYYSTRHKLRHLIANGVNSMFRYGLGNSRYYRRDIFSDHGGVYGSQTTYYVGKSYEKVWATGLKDKTGKTLPDLGWETYYVGSIAIKKFADGRDDTIRVMHSDALGSTTAVTDENGVVVSQSLFDPFGKRQDVIASSSKIDQYQPMEENRGFTGHEEINRTGIIHMNGRIYDMDVGRFMQADPFIQYPSDTQGYNRYAYVQNNPLKFTDPSGFLFKKLLNVAGELTGAKWVLKQLARNKYLNMGVQIGLAFLPGGPLWTAAYVGMYAGAQSYYMTGSLGAGIRAGAIAFGTAYAMHKIGEYARANYGGATEATGISLGKNAAGEIVYASAGNFSKVVAMHAVVGGLSAKASGGKFSHGFFSAGFTKFTTPTIVGNISNQYYQVAASMVVGGTASVISGGKFANGAKTAAYQMIFNQLGGRLKRGHGRPKLSETQKKFMEKKAGFHKFWMKNGDLSVEATGCAGPCASLELEYTDQYGFSGSGALATEWGAGVVLGAGADFTLYNSNNPLIANYDVTWTQSLSVQLGPIGFSTTRVGGVNGPLSTNFELKLRFPGGLGVSGGVGAKLW